MRDFRDAKAMAHTLRAALAAKGLKITVSQALELIAEMFGEADWNTLAAAIRAERTARRHDASPSPPPGAGAAPAPDALVRRVLFSRACEATRHRALAYANGRNHALATLEHLLLALTDDKDASAVIKGCKGDLATLKQDLTNYIDNDLKTLVIDDGGDSSPTSAFLRVIQRAAFQVQSSGGAEVTGADVLVAIFAERESHAVYFLQWQGISHDDAANYVSYGVAQRSADAPTGLRKTTRRVPAALTPREERVLRLRFGIGIDTDHTLQEVGRQFSVSPERIRQLEAKALRKLKHPSRPPKADE